MNGMAKKLDYCHGRFIRCFVTAEQAFGAGNLEPLAGRAKKPRTFVNVSHSDSEEDASPLS